MFRYFIILTSVTLCSITHGSDVPPSKKQLRAQITGNVAKQQAATKQAFKEIFNSLAGTSVKEALERTDVTNSPTKKPRRIG